jgi:D-alanyl-D-alanine carboxypeptidase
MLQRLGIGAITVFLAFLGAAPEIESRTPSQRVEAFIAAVSSGGEAALKEFVERNYAASALSETPAEPRVRRLATLAGDEAPLELRTTREATPDGVTFVAESKKSGRWFEIHLDLEPQPPRGITGVRLQLTNPSATETEPPIRSDEDAARAADAALSSLAREDRFSGVVLIARNGRPFFEKAYGLADREKGVSNSADTRFNIGSIDKAFTQVAIAQLAAVGKLSLADTVRKRLPDDPLASTAAGDATILQLVNMTSGLGDVFGEGYEEAAPRLQSLADFEKLFAGKPLEFPPGKGRGYSNAGYVVLGLIIEKVSGQSYHDYVREHIFTPAGMTASGPSVRTAPAAGRAVGYARESGGAALYPNTDALPGRSSSAGGGLSTARDLLAFDRALAAGKLLPPDWVAWIYSDKSAPPSDAAAAHAASGNRREGLGIAGGSSGVNATLESDNGRGYTLIVLANLDPPAAESVASRIRRWLQGMSPAAAPRLPKT